MLRHVSEAWIRPAVRLLAGVIRDDITIKEQRHAENRG
jgi:hypothetical protein